MIKLFIGLIIGAVLTVALEALAVWYIVIRRNG